MLLFVAHVELLTVTHVYIKDLLLRESIIARIVPLMEDVDFSFLDYIDRESSLTQSNKILMEQNNLLRDQNNLLLKASKATSDMLVAVIQKMDCIPQYHEEEISDIHLSMGFILQRKNGSLSSLQRYLSSIKAPSIVEHIQCAHFENDDNQAAIIVRYKNSPSPLSRFIYLSRQAFRIHKIMDINNDQSLKKWFQVVTGNSSPLERYFKRNKK